MFSPAPSVQAARRNWSTTGVLVAMLVGAFALMTPSIADAASGGTPYKDPNATAAIGLCDRAGQLVTHGSVDTTPFVSRAVSTAPAQAPYNAAGRTATLVAYQPRQDVAAGDWSGDELSASTRYSDPAHPTAVATRSDLSLEGFIQEFPPTWDGLVQLRLYLGAPNRPAYTTTYAATDIKVTGNTWQAVDGGTVDCRDGKAQSIESILLPHVGAKHASSSPNSGSSHHASAQPKHNPASAAPSSLRTTVADASTAASSSGGHSGLLAGTLIGLFVLLVLTGLLAFRGRRS